jgi:hypothetical protein
LLAVQFTSATLAQDGVDPVTGFIREPIHVAAWPGGRKVAVSFALFVEEFGLGQGPVFRPDLATRKPDLVNEAFRQYGIDWGSGKNLVFQAARRRSAAGLSRPSNTAARTVATQCAPRGDQRMRCFLAMRALAISSTQPSAREVEIGSLER